MDKNKKYSIWFRKQIPISCNSRNNRIQNVEAENQYDAAIKVIELLSAQEYIILNLYIMNNYDRQIEFFWCHGNDGPTWVNSLKANISYEVGEDK